MSFMRTEKKLSIYQKELKTLEKPNSFSFYAFIFNSFYFLANGMIFWFITWFLSGLILTFIVFVFFKNLWVIPIVLLLMRILCSVIAPKLKRSYIKDFINRNENVNYNHPVLFYSISSKRLIIYSLISCGFFEFYWFYKNWKAVHKDVHDEEIKPFWQGFIFCFLFILPLMKIIGLNLKRSKTSGKNFSLLSCVYFISFLLQIVCEISPFIFQGANYLLPMLWFIYIIIWLIGLMALAAIQKRINFHNNKSNPRQIPFSKRDYHEIIVVLIGLALNMTLFIIHTPFAQNDENLVIALSSTYRMMVAYPDFCRKQGYEMTQFPKVYAQYFSPEIKTLNHHLQPYHLNMEQAWIFFQIKFKNIMEDSIMKEFMALKPAIIKMIIRQYQEEDIKGFNSQIANEFLDKEITFAVLCAETDRHAYEILDINKDYQKFLRQTVKSIE